MAEPFDLQANFTIIISHFVKHGKEKTFEQTLKQLIAQAKTFQGYNGIDIIKPNDEIQNEYLLLVRFDNQENYKLWKHSDIRKKWSEQLKNYVHKESQVRHEEGLEFWFSQSNAPSTLSPTKWKMAILTWLIIYPLILILSSVLGICLAFLHPYLRMIVVSMILVGGMTYIIMPFITKKFAFWIFKK